VHEENEDGAQRHVWSKGEGSVRVTSRANEHCETHRRCCGARNEDDRAKRLPAEPRAERGKQLEVAAADSVGAYDECRARCRVGRRRNPCL
jgi:hypothetical protein